VSRDKLMLWNGTDIVDVQTHDDDDDDNDNDEDIVIYDD
jgi:hypothetical protein